MIGLNANSLLSSAIAQEASRDTAAAAVSPQGVTEVKPTARINVDLSSAGRSLSTSKQQQSKNSDIDDSNLPDTIKQTLKQIREIRAKLEQALQKLQETMANQHLTAEQRKARVMAIQNEVGSLNAALSAASASLAKLVSDSGLSDEQKITAGMLSMS